MNHVYINAYINFYQNSSICSEDIVEKHIFTSIKGKASVPTDDLIPKIRRCRNQHSMAFQTPIANTDVYKGSFFPQTIRDWNALPDSLISSAEDAEDCVAKFTSLVRARD